MILLSISQIAAYTLESSLEGYSALLFGALFMEIAIKNRKYGQESGSIKPFYRVKDEDKLVLFLDPDQLNVVRDALVIFWKVKVHPETRIRND